MTHAHPRRSSNTAMVFWSAPFAMARKILPGIHPGRPKLSDRGERQIGRRQ